MHPLTPTAAIADDRGNLRVWDYQTGRIINRFNGDAGQEVSLSLVSDLDDSLLLAGAPTDPSACGETRMRRRAAFRWR